MSLRQNALLLVLLAALIGILGDWSGDATLARAWPAPLALLLLGLAYEAWMVARAEPALQLQASPQWLLCRSTPIRIDISTRWHRPAALELAPAAPATIALDDAVVSLQLPAEGAGVWQSTAIARRLGRFEWPSMRSRLGGVLGLAWWQRPLPTAFALRVVPDILHHDERARDAQASGMRAALRTGAGGEILQLRDYQAGDPPRAIDWKATARTGRLISRDFSEDQHLEIVIALDVSRASGLAAGRSDRLALYVNIAARLAQRAAGLDDRVGLLLYADQPLAALAPGRGTAAVSRLRALLAEARIQAAEANPALAAMRIRGMVRHRALVLMLTDLDDSGMAEALLGAARLLMPKHLPFIAGVSNEAAQTLSLRPAADEFEVFESIAAQRYCAGMSRNVHALRALGAACVLAPPATLDRAVLEAYSSFRSRRRV